jgi:hypothetical protein
MGRYLARMVGWYRHAKEYATFRLAEMRPVESLKSEDAKKPVAFLAG